MIDRLKPYPSYRRSGVEWLGDVPEHWEVQRLRQVAQLLVSNVDKHSHDGETLVRLCNYVDVYKNDRITEGIPFMVASATREEVERFRLREGDVAITKDSEIWNDIAVPALVECEAPDLVYGYHLAILRPRGERLQGSYLFRAIQSRGVATQFHVAAAGVTRFGLSHHAIKTVLIPLPPLQEQAAIVRFLDWADRRIRRVIRARQKRIRLLEEYKTALIQRVVTGQIDVRTGQPYPAYKPSGVEWLREVPAHWQVRQLKTLVDRIDQGVSPQAENYPATGDAWGVLKAGCVNRGIFREQEHKRLPIGYAVDESLAVKPGDILVSRASGSADLVGSTGRVREINSRLILCDKIFRPVFRSMVEPEFMVMAMNSRYYRQQVEMAISGAEGLANNLPLSSLRSFVVAIPPIEESRALVGHLLARIEAVTRAITRSEQTIELLREFYTRLAADIITGKLDVREVAASLPEEPEAGEPDLPEEEEAAEVAESVGEEDGEAVPEEAAA